MVVGSYIIQLGILLVGAKALNQFRDLTSDSTFLSPSFHTFWSWRTCRFIVQPTFFTLKRTCQNTGRVDFIRSALVILSRMDAIKSTTS